MLVFIGGTILLRIPTPMCSTSTYAQRGISTNIFSLGRSHPSPVLSPSLSPSAFPSPSLPLSTASPQKSSHSFLPWLTSMCHQERQEIIGSAFMMCWAWGSSCVYMHYISTSVLSPVCDGTVGPASLEGPRGKHGTSGSLLDARNAEAGFALSPGPCSPSNTWRIRREGSEHRT